MNILLKNPSHTLQRSADFNLQVCFISEKEFNVHVWIFYKGTRNVCIASGNISEIWYDLGGFYLWFAGPPAC
jgi:hypothetical protein